MKKKILIIILIIILIFSLFHLFIKFELKSAFSNTLKNKNINYNTNIKLKINDKNNKSSINYKIIRSNGVINIKYNQKLNDNKSSTISKYYIINNNKNYEYVLNNGTYEKKQIDKIDYIFNIDYKKIKKDLKNINYKGIKVIDGKKYKLYTSKTKVYNAYNYIYSNDVLNKKDNNSSVLLNIYVDKENNFIYKISYKIKNLNNGSDSNTNVNYNVEIINSDINNTNIINLPKNS